MLVSQKLLTVRIIRLKSRNKFQYKSANTITFSECIQMPWWVLSLWHRRRSYLLSQQQVTYSAAFAFKASSRFYGSRHHKQWLANFTRRSHFEAKVPGFAGLSLHLRILSITMIDLGHRRVWKYQLWLWASFPIQSNPHFVCMWQRDSNGISHCWSLHAKGWSGFFVKCGVC